MNRGQGLLGQMPDLESIYSQYGLTPESINDIYNVDRVGQAYDPAKLKEAYEQQRGLLGQAQAQQVSQAQSSAGAQAGARGLANPSAFIQQSANPIQQMYARQVGELGARETEALRQLSLDRFGAEQRMREGGYGARQGLAGLLAQLRQQGFQNRMGIEQFMGQEGYIG